MRSLICPHCQSAVAFGDGVAVVTCPRCGAAVSAPALRPWRAAIVSFVCAMTVLAGVRWIVLRGAQPPKQAYNPVEAERNYSPETRAYIDELDRIIEEQKHWTLEEGPGEQTATNGEIEIRVKLAFEPVQYESRENLDISEVPYAVARVSITNHSTAQKVGYEGWNVGPFDWSAWLTDEHDNHYRRIREEYGTEYLGHVREAVSIYPGKSRDDLLAFEFPVEAARRLTLHLPLSALGKPKVVLEFHFESDGNARTKQVQDATAAFRSILRELREQRRD